MDFEKVKTSFKYLLASASIISIYGILEHFGKSPSCLFLTGSFDVSCWVQDVQARVFATLGQPNWMAAWLVAIMPLSWAAAISKIKDRNLQLQVKIKNPWIWIIISGILFTALLYTKSRSGLLGFATASAVFWLGLAWINKNYLSNLQRPFLILNLLFLILVLIFGTRWTPSILGLVQQKTYDRQLLTENETALEHGGTDSGELRKIVWKGARDIWKAYPLLGSGVETFAYSYYNFRPAEHNLTSEWNFLYNKAHNEYLNYLATTGILGLGSYLFLIGSFLWWSVSGVKNTKTEIKENQNSLTLIHNSILAGYCSILVTNFIGFSVVSTATLFFLYPAMALALTHRSAQAPRLSDIGQASNKSKKLALKSSCLNTLKLRLLLIPIILLVSSYLLLRISSLWLADTLYAQANKFLKSGYPIQATENLDHAIFFNSSEPLYHDKLATAYSTIAASLQEENETEEAQKFAELAHKETDQAYSTSPRNLSLLKSRASTFNRLASVNPSYFIFSLATLERAGALAPTDPLTQYNLSVAYLKMDENQKAMETLENLVQIKPDYLDARYALAQIYSLEGKTEKAKEQLEFTLKHISPNNAEILNLLNHLQKNP